MSHALSGVRASTLKIANPNASEPPYDDFSPDGYEAFGAGELIAGIVAALPAEPDTFFGTAGHLWSILILSLTATVNFFLVLSASENCVEALAGVVRNRLPGVRLPDCLCRGRNTSSSRHSQEVA